MADTLAGFSQDPFWKFTMETADITPKHLTQGNSIIGY